MARGFRLVDRLWQRSPTGQDRRSRQGFRYQAYVPHTLADSDARISSSLGAILIDAELACRALNDDPPALQSLEALARQLLRAEAVASSRIEGLLLSHRRLARAAADADLGDQTAHAVLGNMRAMEAAIAIGSGGAPLTASTVLEIHRILLAGTRDEHLGGVVREEQNWIGGESSSPANADFVPPPPEEVGGLLDDLCAFAGRDDVPAVLQGAVVHAQFETIHPFADGNGRVGRALIHAVLRRRGVTPRFSPPVSLVLAGRADAYVKGLTSFRFGDDEDWYQLFANTLLVSAEESRRFAAAVLELKERWREAARHPRRGSAAAALIELLPSHPVINLRSAEEITGASDEAVRVALMRLENAGVVRQTTVGRRNRAWECVGLFALLDAFEGALTPGHARAPTR